MTEKESQADLLPSPLFKCCASCASCAICAICASCAHRDAQHGAAAHETVTDGKRIVWTAELSTGQPGRPGEEPRRCGNATVLAHMHMVSVSV